MKTSATIAISVFLSVTLAVRTFAGPVGIARSFPVATTPSVARYDPGPAITCLDKASMETLRAARANKNNGYFLRKNSEIKDLIRQLKTGKSVPREEISKALNRLRLWF